MKHQAKRSQNPRSQGSSALVRNAALACLAFALAPVAASAQDAAPATQPQATANAQLGVVYGKVSNAATGDVLQRARVTVEGTFVETFTDDFGEYRLELPEGTTNIKVSYTGMKDKILDVEVIGGETIMQDFNIVGEGIASTGTGKDEVVMLDAFAVTEGRETNAYNIANNEQRYAVNIKNVVAADAFGDVTEGNIGEFIKYLPGISVDYVAADIRTINVRGFASNFTNVSFNGMRITSSASGSKSRVIELEQVSINNVARAEVTKVPTPDQPADTLGGNVNMISKNSFERKGVSFNWRAYASVNAENLTFGKTPGPKDKDSFKILPGFDFDLTIPFSKNFGIVLTGLSSNQYNEQHRSQMVWQFNQNKATEGAATATDPYMNNYEFQDGPKATKRNSINIRADWRIAPGHTLNVGYQNNFYNNFFGNRNMRFTIGNTATGSNKAINGITPTSVTDLMWSGSDYVQSATGGSTKVTQGSSYRNKNGQTQAVDMLYRMKVGDWEGDAGIHAAVSKSWYRDLGRGHFNNVGTQMWNATTIRMEDMVYPNPSNIVVKDQTGSEIDYTDLSNYYVSSAETSEIDAKATMKGAFFNLKKTFDWGIPIGVKTGYSAREETRDNTRLKTVYEFVGPDGKTKSADDMASLYAQDNYANTDPYWSLPKMNWVSPWKLADLFESNPEYFKIQKDGTEAQKYAAQNSEYLKERVQATYLQFDGRMFHNKLRWITGVRFERTDVRGEGTKYDPGAIYQKNADGSYVLDENNKKIFIDGITSATSLDAYNRIYTVRGTKAKGSYDGLYPSLSADYDLSENVKFRFAYALTYGRPDLSNIVPTIEIPELSIIEDPETGAVSQEGGTIKVANPELKPWEANNVDLSFEYYHPKGGTLQIGVFRKWIDGFFNNEASPTTQALADQYGFDFREYGSGWELSKKINGGKARISGLEFNINQPLKNFGSWGKNLNLLANGTWLRLEGDKTADFNNFIPRTGNIGLTWSKKPFVLMVKLNHRGRQKQGIQTSTSFQRAKLSSESAADYESFIESNGGYFYQYYRSRTFLDINFTYQMTKKLSFFANVRNALNKAQDLIKENSVTPLYASQYRTEEYGLQWAVGVKGKF